MYKTMLVKQYKSKSLHHRRRMPNYLSIYKKIVHISEEYLDMKVRYTELWTASRYTTCGRMS